MDDLEDEFGPVEPDDYDEESDIPSDMTQHMLLSYLSSNHEMWIRCAPVLKKEYFDDEFQPVLECIREFERENHLLPSKSLVRADTGINLETPEDSSDPRLVQIVCDRVEEFCRGRATINFLLSSADTIHEDRSRGTLSSLVAEMNRIASMTVHQDLGYEVHESVAELLKRAEQSDGLPTHFDFLDHSLNGGVTRPSFNLISAASGQGKSIYLQNQAVNYARDGNNVVYISLELPEFMLEKRFASMMTETDINMVYSNMDVVVRKMRNAAKREGKIQIKRMKMTGITVADIRAFVHELESSTQQEWTHIMIDYMDLMRPMQPGIRLDNIHLKDQAISEELYEWTHEPESNKIIWSASQQVKGAKDEKDARQSGVAGGVGKVNTCDNLIILKRTLEDIQDERCWGFIEKGRNGGQGRRIPFRWDSLTQRMSNPTEMEELYIEANTPGSSEKEKPKSRLQNDPLANKERQSSKPPVGGTKANIQDRIKRMRQRGVEK